MARQVSPIEEDAEVVPPIVEAAEEGAPVAESPDPANAPVAEAVSPEAARSPSPAVAASPVPVVRGASSGRESESSLEPRSSSPAPVYRERRRPSGWASPFRKDSSASPDWPERVRARPAAASSSPVASYDQGGHRRGLSPRRQRLAMEPVAAAGAAERSEGPLARPRQNFAYGIPCEGWPKETTKAATMSVAGLLGGEDGALPRAPMLMAQRASALPDPTEWAAVAAEARPAGMAGRARARADRRSISPSEASTVQPSRGGSRGTGESSTLGGVASRPHRQPRGAAGATLGPARSDREGRRAGDDGAWMPWFIVLLIAVSLTMAWAYSLGSRLDGALGALSDVRATLKGVSLEGLNKAQYIERDVGRLQAQVMGLEVASRAARELDTGLRWSLAEEVGEVAGVVDELRGELRDDAAALKHLEAKVNELADRFSSQVRHDRVNHFARGQGARIDPYRTSSTAKHTTTFFERWFTGLEGRERHGPREALRSWDDIGDCWCAEGGQTALGVRTGRRVFPTRLNVEHIPTTATLDDGSAPREMELWVRIEDSARRTLVHAQVEKIFGLSPSPNREDGMDDSWIRISSFEHTPSAAPHRQSSGFEIPVDLESLGVDVQDFVVRTTSNWGSELATCFYRVGLEGKVSTLPLPSTTVIHH